MQAVDAQGAPVFQVDPFWPKPLPNKWSMQQIDAVKVGSKGNIYTGEIEDGKRVQKFVPVMAGSR